MKNFMARGGAPHENRTDPVGTLGRYRELVGRAEVAPLLLGLVLNGASTGVPLAIIVAVGAAEGFAPAGVAAGFFAVGVGISSPVRGRLVDRYGQTSVFLGLGALRWASLLALAVAVQAEAAQIFVLVFSALAGLTPPPLTSGLRALWRDLVDEAELKSAYALHAVVNELLFVIGPVVAGLLIAAISPVAALLSLAAIELLGTAIFVTAAASRSWRGKKRDVGRLGAMSSLGIRLLAAVNIPLGMAFGALDVTAPALAARHDQTWTAGLAIGALGAGSVLGGLLYGTRDSTAPPARRLTGLLCMMAVGLVPMAFVRSVPTLILAMALAGVAVAPAVATVFTLIDDVAPAGTATEAMTWIVSAYAVGTAVGTSVTGRLVEDHLDLALWAGAVCAAAAGLLALAGTPSLRPLGAGNPVEEQRVSA
jgi:predicted MFS family arabinose efflux permease